MLAKVKSFFINHKLVVIVLAGLVILYIVLSKLSPAQSASSSGGVDPNVQVAAIQAGAQNAAVAAQANAQTNQLQAQLASQASNQAFQLKDDELKAQLSNNQIQAAALVANNQTQAQVDIAGLSLQAQQSLNNSQTQVALAQVQGQVALGQFADQTQQNLAAIQANATTQIAGYAADVNKTQIISQLGIVQSNNDTAAAINSARIAGQVAAYQTEVAGQLGVADIAGQVAMAQIGAQSSLNNATIGLIQSGQLNKGGSGGAAQIAALSGAYNQPGIASAAYANASNVSAANSPGATLSGIGNLISGAGNFAKSVGSFFL